MSTTAPRSGASSPIVFVAPQHALASSLGTINEIVSADGATLDGTLLKTADNALPYDQSEALNKAMMSTESVASANNDGSSRTWRQRIPSMSARVAPRKRSRVDLTITTPSPIQEGVPYPWNPRNSTLSPVPTSAPLPIEIPTPASPVATRPDATGFAPSRRQSQRRSVAMSALGKGAPPTMPRKVERTIEVFEAPLPHAPSEPRSPLSPLHSVNHNPANTRVLAPKSANASTTQAGSEESKPKSAWKRGVERLWRSKSASGLRESFQRKPSDAPPVPALPRQHQPSEKSSSGVKASIVAPRGTAAASCVSLSVPKTPVVVDSPLMSEDDPIYSELDKRYPSFPARAPIGSSPVPDDEDTFEMDPFASHVDYVGGPRSSSRASRMLSRSPLPEFSPALSSVALPERPTTMKSALMPRLRKSRSMVVGRPSSIVGLFTDRKKSIYSGFKGSPLGNNDWPAPRLDEIAATAPPQDVLEPPTPLFYDTFDIASDDEGEQQSAPVPVGIRNDWSQPIHDNFDEAPPSSSTAEIMLSQQLFYRGSPAPELLLDNGGSVSLSGHSAEIATPTPYSAPAHVTSYTLDELDPSHCSNSDRRLPLEQVNSKPSYDFDHDHHLHHHQLHHHHQHQPASIAFDQSSVSSCEGPRESASFKDLYQQLGIWPDQAEQWLEDQLPERYQAFPSTDDPAWDDRSVCDPSPLGSPPRASWEADIHRGLTPDNLVLSTSTAFHSAYTSPVHSRNASVVDFEMLSRDMENESGSRSSSERRRSAAADGRWSLESDTSDEGENDDVPLSKLHPAAGAAQEKRLVDAVRRREVRRAERERALRQSKSQLFERERERLVKREKELQREASRSDRAGRPTRPEWNGEGGVPANVLAGRLERVAVSSSPQPSAASEYRSASAAVSRSQTMRAPSGGRPSDSPARNPRHAHTSQGDASSSSPTPPNHGAAMSRSGTGSHGVPGNPSRSLQTGAPLSLSSSRATTTSTNSGNSGPSSLGRSNTSVSRRRGVSNSHEQPMALADAPPVPRRGVPVRCVIQSAAGERPLSLEIFPETTARDVLSRARETAHLVDGSSGPTSGWVVCESFSELGLERHLREYEVIANVTRGWDAQAKGNCLVVRESHHANQSLAKAVSDSAPMTGGWVQLETKRGKWSKRWLETRGGHIFISKNDKGKDELQINTLFSDVYTPSQSYPSPQRHVFALKRLEPLASFEKPSEHVHYISTDDANGWKLSTASYGSRSFTLVSAQKHAQISHTPHSVPSGLGHATSLKRAKSQSHATHPTTHSEHPALPTSNHLSSASMRRPSRQAAAPQPPPLVDLKAGVTRQPTNQRMTPATASGFTGKGLLGNI